MKQLLSFLFFFSFIYSGEAQTRYLIQLKNKGGTPYTFTDPSAYLSPRAIARRIRYSIAIDSTDLPPTPSYINSIRSVPNVTLLNVSKWFNSVTIQTTDNNALATISNFPFVQSVTGIAARNEGGASAGKWNGLRTEEVTHERPNNILADFYNYGTNAYNEIHLHNGEFLHNIGLRGQGMHIALLDAGFFNYPNLRAFDSVVINGQVLSTWDFVNREPSVTEDNAHGMQVFSTIAANIPGEFVGKAPKASFHLFRTEDVSTEYFIEEHNWVCGAERADSVGSDLISASVGYTTFDFPGFDHPYSHRNGNIALATIGADLAAKKGLLVFAAIGNIIDASTQFLSIPSDGDSVVAVGSVNSMGIVASNSSFGPSSDGQVKPDVASVGAGAVVQSTSNTIGTSNGTSFACPNMAGLTSCLWQGFPEFNNMRIVEALRRAGSRAGNPDDRMGYGIPNMKAAFSDLLEKFATSSSVLNGCSATITWTSKDVQMMKYEIERMLPGQGYVKIGEVTPQAGTVLANRTYQFNNNIIHPAPGSVHYRILQIIDTAAATYSAVYIDTTIVTTISGCFATGNPDPGTSSNFFLVQPNPVQGNTAVLMTSTSQAIPAMIIRMFDGKGSVVYQYSTSKPAGRFSYDLPIGNLAAGKYYIRIYDKGKNLGVVQFIKL